MCHCNLIVLLRLYASDDVLKYFTYCHRKIFSLVQVKVESKTLYSIYGKHQVVVVMKARLITVYGFVS